MKPQVAIASHNFTLSTGQDRCNGELALALSEVADVHVVAVHASPEVEGAVARVRRLRLPDRPGLAKVAAFVHLASRELAGFRGLVIATGATLWRSDLNVVHMCHRAWLAAGGARGGYPELYTRLNAAWEGRALAGTRRRIVAVSGQVRDQLVALHGVDPDRVVVIPAGVDPDRYRPGEAGEAALPHRTPGRPVLLFAGDLGTPLKGLDTVLAALALEPGLPWDLWVAGSGRRNPYPALAARLGLSDRVHFLGHRADLPEVMRAADTLVFPSRYDAFGLVVLEAMASGLPSIVSSRAGAVELVTPGVDGWVLDPPDDVAALASRLRGLAADPALLRRAGAAARATALQHGPRAAAEAYRTLVLECRA